MNLRKWRQGALGFLLKGLVISLSFAAVFAVTYRLNQRYLQEAAGTVTVVTAKTDLLPGEPLVPEKLQLTETAVLGIGADFASDIDGLFANGPWYIGGIGFGAGDILRPGRLVPAAAAGGDWRWEFSRRERVRLIAVETSLARSGGDWLRPGMRADAMVYLPAKDSYEASQPSRIIGPEEDPFLRDLLVVDKKNADGISLDTQGADEAFSRDLLPAVVILMLDEGDTDRIKALIRYNEEGKLYFSPTSDTEE